MLDTFGPPAWRILHGLAARLGRQSKPLLAQQEAYEWIAVLVSLQPVLPCEVCQGHYKQWLGRRNPEQFRRLRGSELRAAAERWVWDLHEAVNARRGVVGVAFEEAAARAAAYDPAAFRADVATIQSQFEKRTLTANKLFRNHLTILAKLLGLM